MGKLICGNALEVLAGMDAESVHCCISSPPYWGLRSYEGTESVFGGDEGCEHEWGQEIIRPKSNKNEGFGERQAAKGQRWSSVNLTETVQQKGQSASQGSFCQLCGAWRGQFGLEPTPEMYVEHTLEFLRAIWRVLRNDGTLWLNLGDSYASGKGSCFNPGGGPGSLGKTRKQAGAHPLDRGNISTLHESNLKPKDLVMIPFRVALAAQADGWWVRSDIIWHKPNPMPESVTDRPTTSHEHVLLLAKSGTSQYWTHRDRDGTRARPEPDYRWVNQLTEEEVDYGPPDWKKKVTCPKCQGTKRIMVTVDVMGAEASWKDDCDFCADGRGRPKGKVQLWQRINLWQGHDYYYDADAIREKPAGYKRKGGNAPYTAGGSATHGIGSDSLHQMAGAGRNKRTVWTISTKPYSGPHYACADEETEALTASGWKKRTQLQAGDQIACYDMEIGKLRWGRIMDVYSYDVAGEEMIAAKGRGVDFLLTTNHRCIIQRRQKGTYGHYWKDAVVTADDLKPSHKILVASPWFVSEDEEMRIEPDLAELVGWFVTEGSIGNNTVLLYQSGSHNPEYCDDIRGLLNRLGADYTERSRWRPYKDREVLCVSWRIRRAVANELLALCESKKRLPRDFLLWNQEALERLYDGLMKGDGHFRSGGRQTFVQKDRVLIEQVQALMVRLGYTTTLTKRSEHTWSLYKTESQTRLLRSEAGELLRRQLYTGKVWCPVTGVGTFVARRGGRTFITGNTFPPDLIEPMILAGTSPKVCAECGGPWERVIEKQTKEPSYRKGNKPEIAHAYWGESETRTLAMIQEVQTLGWCPTCSCESSTTKPATVADPFCGTATVAEKCIEHSRDYVMIDIDPKSIEMAEERIAQVQIRLPVLGADL